MSNPAWDPLTAPSWPDDDKVSNVLDPSADFASIEDTQSIRPVAPRPPDVDQILRGEYTGWVPIIKAGESLDQAQKRATVIPSEETSNDASVDVLTDSTPRVVMQPAKPSLGYPIAPAYQVARASDSMWFSVVDDPETSLSPALALEEARMRIAKMRENLTSSMPHSTHVESQDVYETAVDEFVTKIEVFDSQAVESTEASSMPVAEPLAAQASPETHISEPVVSQVVDSAIAQAQSVVVDSNKTAATDILQYEDLFESLIDAGIEDDEDFEEAGYIEENIAYSPRTTELRNQDNVAPPAADVVPEVPVEVPPKPVVIAQTHIVEPEIPVAVQLAPEVIQDVPVAVQEVPHVVEDVPVIEQPVSVATIAEQIEQEIVQSNSDVKLTATYSNPDPQTNALELVIMRDEIKDLRERLDHSQRMIEELMHRIANLAEMALTQRNA